MQESSWAMLTMVSVQRCPPHRSAAGFGIDIDRETVDRETVDFVPNYDDSEREPLPPGTACAS